MQASQVPPKFPITFAVNAGGGYIRAIPQASQIGIQNGAASLNDGFPPVTFLPLGSGGTPPFGQDMNGILAQITQWTQWQNAGGLVVYDSAFSTSIGGYPKGALLASSATPGLLWISTADNNLTNPDGGSPANWSGISSNTVLQSSLVHGGTDTGSANVVTVASVNPSVSSVTAFMQFEITKNAAPNTSTMTATIAGQFGNVVWADGSPMAAADWGGGVPAILMFDGTNYRVMSVMGPTVYARQSQISSAVLHTGTDVGTTNAASVASVLPTQGSVAIGSVYEITKINAANTTAMTISILGQSGTLQWPDGSALVGGDWPALAPALIQWNGSVYTLLTLGGPSSFARAPVTTWLTTPGSGTWNPLPGYRHADIIATAGGAAGGSSSGSSGDGTGGSAGMTVMGTISTLGLSNVPYTVGAGGTPASATAASGTTAGAGQDTTFGTGAIQFTAKAAASGGVNKVTAGGPAPAASTGGVVPAGGAIFPGCSGEQMVASSNGNRGTSGGASYWGGSGQGVDGNPVPAGQGFGLPGFNGGGGGGSDSANKGTPVQGGAGGAGLIKIVQY